MLGVSGTGYLTGTVLTFKVAGCLGRLHLGLIVAEHIFRGACLSVGDAGCVGLAVHCILQTVEIHQTGQCLLSDDVGHEVV